MSDLERRAEEWIAPYWNAEHLRRSRDWALELDRAASEAVRLAALTHDMERHFPGGPSADPSAPPDEPTYLREHSERSARIVGEWLRGESAGEELVAEVEELVRLHEVGGTPPADIVQAADSLSFLDVNWEVTLRWVREGRATPAQSRAKLDWTLERMRVGRELAVPLYERAVAALEEAA
ncbi:MAG TPA: hypothetical protein VGJ77_15855 [Gaiellaceae bacterium]